MRKIPTPPIHLSVSLKPRQLARDAPNKDMTREVADQTAQSESTQDEENKTCCSVIIHYRV